MDTKSDEDLKLLLEQVNDWFITLKDPISPLSLEDDKQKLEHISETTVDWFSTLTNPITNEGIEDDISDNELKTSSDDVRESPKKCNTKQKPNNGNNKGCKRAQRKPRSKPGVSQESSLDSLAKDLELLLEEHENKDHNEILNKHEEPAFYFYTSYTNDDLALLDDSIGCCCSISQANQSKFISSSQFEDEDSFVVVRNSDGFGCERRNESNQQQTDNDLKIQTSMPLDHDYLPKPKARPLVLSNKLIQEARNTRPKELKVLNTDVLKKFARFSYQFRMLNERLLAIENK